MRHVGDWGNIQCLTQREWWGNFKGDSYSGLWLGSSWELWEGKIVLNVGEVPSMRQRNMEVDKVS